MVQRHCGVRTATRKLIHDYEIGEWELFDLVAAPQEPASGHGDPADADADVQGAREVRLTQLREEYAVPDEDPVPYVTWPPGG